MNHAVFLCFHSLKYAEDNCTEITGQDNRFWKKGRSPDPGFTQSRLSCGLRLACSDVLLVNEMFPVMETVQPPWAAVPPLGCTQGEKVFYLQPDLSVFQLVLLPLIFPPNNTGAWFRLLHPLLLMSGMLLGVPEDVSSLSQARSGSTDSSCRTRTPVVPPW